MTEKLARQLLTEVPAAQITEVIASLDRLGKSRVMADGGFCGMGCDGTGGSACGMGCSGVTSATVGVLDAANKAGFTRADLSEAKANLAGFKENLLSQAKVMGIRLG